MQRLSKQCLSIIQTRPQNSHKGTFGRTVLVGGNAQFGGAIMMSAEACVNAGSGLTTVMTDPSNHPALHARMPEAMTVDWNDKELCDSVLDSADVILIGPGLGEDKKSQDLLSYIFQKQKEDQLLVIDGSAITLFAKGNEQLPYPTQTIFTPHQMEWQRLSGVKIADQTEENNQKEQKKLQATIVLKSHHTEIYSNQGRFQNPLGNPGMATGGTGDTLAGIISGFLAQFPDTVDATNAAVYLHSYIADQLAHDNYVVLPTKISQALPYWMKKFEH
ncbi:NAD(P)H-hydrate dehydratase [Tetragenococcus koreensis]|uniref:ADP-dependent (S)-NAD(P)H-hydrate dehydratase n=1 Tax=Tetragenococcus koreensis TaxID=290335 RepID=A0AAN4UAY4_9ENTE|nr:NAD(P)H-hydrate dehydratase [Tetragenococcus koreensis]MDN6507968.1 NAD(P)H-hydrate dehydratase [Tetragenococcus halophilus]AYW46130.1 NAD(P)H-hydrate dehydratase [Tetragenococcus koreensis]MCF1618326.1 NAD(P)H-hydrate dehydratase [Tetragenococcus koreensis]MCF1623114.1 NAD(P)H-hydrate dehydratase [Tetragenococcus koreensis]MCF1627429.1 NAD(P)H-hydrate dehydratase [Tetragenococcus koreensis]